MATDPRGWRDVSDLTADGGEVQIHLGEQDGSARLDLYRKIMPLAVAKFEEAGRVTGWREAIEALRAEAACRGLSRPVEALDLRRAADFLESLAPKDAP